MDCRNELPPLQEGKVLNEKDISAFGLSLQGASHVAKGTSCQDYCDLRYLKKEELFLAAMADGVGSCALSHWGAYTAVSAVLDAVQAELETFSAGRKLVLDTAANKTMKEIMVKGFRAAQNGVEELADRAGELVFHFQSTLTLAIYDGCNLFFGHVGDDGIVVQTTEGNVEMLTSRMKGEETSSVFPLQSGDTMWRFGRSAKPVAGFVMATDGVLDAFVANRPDYFGVNYNNGVCYAFMEDAIDTLAENTPDSPQNALNSYKAYMLSEKYREAVTDDLTLIAVVSREAMKNGVHPKFSMKIWNAVQEASNEARRQLLRGKPVSPVGRIADMAPASAETKTAAKEPETAAAAPEPESPVFSKPEKKGPGIWALLLVAAISLILGAFLRHMIQLPKDKAQKAACEQHVQSFEALEQKYTDLDAQLSDTEQLLAEKDTACEELAAENDQLRQELASVQKAMEELKAAETTEAQTDMEKE